MKILFCAFTRENISYIWCFKQIEIKNKEYCEYQNRF